MKFLLGLTLLIQASILFAQDSVSVCQNHMQQRMLDLKDPNFGSTKHAYESLQESLYYNCRFGFSIESSWLCLDRESFAKTSTREDKALHFNDSLKAWFETTVNSSYAPNVMRYSLGEDQGRRSRLQLGEY
jgi:hypothetical protein